MASYGALVRKITTAEINRVTREGNYARWSYFIDQTTHKVGVIFANDTHFGAYNVEDEPDPKLYQFGLEQIKDLTLTPDPKQLIVTAGDNRLEAVVFNDPATVLDDDFLPSFSYAAAPQWQHFLRSRGVQVLPDNSQQRNGRIIIAAIAAMIILFLIFALKK